EQVALTILLQNVPQRGHDLLRELACLPRSTQAVAREGVRGVIQSHWHNDQARTVEEKAAVDVRPAVAVAAKGIAFLRGRTQRQPCQAMELAQKLGRIDPRPGLLDQSR